MTGEVFRDAACHSDIGGREEQQDRVAIFTRAEAALLVLADGMGGHEGGALAAQAVIDVAREQFDTVRRCTARELLVATVEGAHERINGIGAERGIQPRTTCVLLHLTATEAHWAHVGDSRLYRFDNARFIDRTIDHSVVELMRLQGRISEEEMKTHPDQNRLYAALGGERQPEMETGCAPIRECDGFLLASDGLWENIGEGRLAAIFKSRELPAALHHLVAQAKAAGGADCDNVSVAAVRCQRRTDSWASRVIDVLGLARK